MATVEDYLSALVEQKNALADILVEKGIEADKSEKFNTLIPKVVDIQSGSDEYLTLYKALIENVDYAPTSLPEGITKIAPYAFYQRKELALTSLPSTLTEIGTFAFNNCSKMNLTEIPNGVKVLTPYAFERCYNAMKTLRAEGLTELQGHCLSYCYLTEAYFPNVKIIGQGWNDFNTNLKKVTFGTLTSVHTGAFNRENTAMEEIIVGEGTTSSLYLQRLPNLTATCLANLINNLADMTGKTAPTITVHENCRGIDQAHLDRINSINWIHNFVLAEG